MRRLSKLQNMIFLVGGLLMVVGSGLYAFLLEQEISPFLYLCGAVAFVSMQVQQRYEGSRIVIRRLRKIMLVADFCFVFAGLLVVEQQHRFVADLLAGHGDAYITFVNATYGKWVVVLLVAAILELYTTHRLSSELEKENAEKTLKE